MTGQGAVQGDPRRELRKRRLPGRPAEMIGLLLVNGSMSVKSLMVAMHCGKDTVYQSGGRYSLKGF